MDSSVVTLEENSLFQENNKIWYTTGEHNLVLDYVSNEPYNTLMIVETYFPTTTDSEGNSVPDEKNIRIKLQTENLINTSAYGEIEILLSIPTTGGSRQFIEKHVILTAQQNYWLIFGDELTGDESYTGESAYFSQPNTQYPNANRDFTDGSRFYIFNETNFVNGVKPQARDSLYSMLLSDYIAQNILSDYENGISEAQVQIGCSDYLDSKGNNVKNWSQGEILEVGDIILIYPRQDKKENFLGCVTNRRVEYTGCPFESLTLQELHREQLQTPTIALEESILSWGKIENANLYFVYADNSLIAEINDDGSTNSFSIDLFDILSDFDEHEIYIIASSLSYKNSKESNRVTYTRFKVIDNGDGSITIINASVIEEPEQVTIGV